MSAELRYIILCEGSQMMDVANDKKIIIVSPIVNIDLAELPMKINFNVFISIDCLEAKKEYKVEWIMTSQNNDEIANGIGTIQTADDTSRNQNIQMGTQVYDCEFKYPGEYKIIALLDGEEIGEQKFHVYVRNQ